MSQANIYGENGPQSTDRSSTPTNAELETIARKVRATCVQMAFDGREGHLSSSMSCIDALVALYGGWLNVDPDNPKDPNRDRFLFSKGHAVTALYATLAAFGHIPASSLSTYGQENSPLQNHPCCHLMPQIEISSGSLGHGLGMATGMHHGMELDQRPGRVVVLMGDGECNEGSVWEAAAFACARKQTNLLAIVDNNNVQAVGTADELLGFTSFEDKFRAFGWSARTIDGNDMAAFRAALGDVPFEAGRPSAIISKTKGGAGVSFMEDKILWHYRCPDKEEVSAALDEIGDIPLYSVA